MKDKTKLLVVVLFVVIVILLGIILYALVLKPVISGYVIRTQNEGYQYAILQIMQQAAQCQQVPLTFGNQTINLVAVECLQQPQQS